MPQLLEPRQFLRAATIEGARILKLDGELGSLSSGKEASFIAFDLNSPNLTIPARILSAPSSTVPVTGRYRRRFWGGGERQIK